MIKRAGSRVRPAREALAQLKHPPEFRVPRPFLEPAQAAWVEAALHEAEAEAVGAAQAVAGPDRSSDGADSTALVGTAVGIWRALRKLGQDAHTLSAADLRQVRRQINASRQALADDGLEIQDHDGMAFDSGLSLEVLLFQDEPGLSRETVLETVRPSVYFRGARLQMGQVIVGRPAPGPDRGPLRQPDAQGEHKHA